MAKKTSKQSRGGQERAKKLSAERRSEIAKKAAEGRWSKAPLAEYEGQVPFGDLMIPCAVLADGTRVLSERGVAAGFGLKRSGSNWQRKKEDGPRLPVFASARNLEQFISDELRKSLLTPIPYRSPTNPGAIANGVRADVIPQLCDIWLRARDAGVLKQQQQHIAVQADIVMRGLAHIGIIALVDEATGYQADRTRDALSTILQEFIAKELSRWVKRFPDEFYEQLARLRGVKLSTISPKKPQYFGHLTNDLVYARLAPGVLDELKRLTPRDGKGNTKHHFHRRLTTDVGHPRLQEHLAAVIALMRASSDWRSFKKLLDKALPKLEA